MALTVVVVLPSPPPPPPPPPEQIVVVVLPSPPPPPPPARVVVMAPARVRPPLVLRVAAGALIFLDLAGAWIMSAATAAEVVARRAWGEGSAPVLFLQAVMYGAVKVCVCIILALLALVVLRLCTKCVAYVIAPVSGSTSGFRKSTFGAIRPELTAHLFRLLRPVVLGFVVDMAFLLLIATGLLVETMSPHVEGSISQREMVGSVITDVGYLVFTRQLAFLSSQLSFLFFGGSARRTGTHHRSSVEMKLRREGVRRILQGATVPVQLMVVSDPNRYKFSVENRVFADCFFLLVDLNRR